MKFEVGKLYMLHDKFEWEKTAIMTVLSRTDKTITVMLNGCQTTLNVAENAFKDNCESCSLKGYRLKQAKED